MSDNSASTLLTIFGGRLADIRTLLLEERLPDGWESRIRAPWGLTMAKFNATVLPVELAVDERPVVGKMRNLDLAGGGAKDVDA